MTGGRDMNRIFLLAAVTGIFLAAGCQKADEGSHPVILYALTPTRTSVEFNIFSWQEDETIAVGTAYPEGNPGEEFVSFSLVDASTGAFSHTFEGEDPTLGVAVSPAFAAGIYRGDNDYTVTLPRLYEGYVPGTTNALMIGTKISDTPVRYRFHHAGAVIKVTYVNVPAGTSELGLSTDYPLAGTVTLHGTSVEETEITNQAQGLYDYEIRICLAEAVQADGATVSFYVPLPTGTYNYLSVYLLKGDEWVQDSGKSLNRSLTLSRGDILTLPPITFPMETGVGFGEQGNIRDIDDDWWN